jgi:hypothetical protein
MIISLLTAGPVAAAGLPPGGTFTDDDGDVHEGSIEAIAVAGITVGCNPPANNRYCPDDAVTRAQMATFLTRALQLEPSDTNRFTDDNGNVHEGSIEAIAAAGITLGCNPPANNRYCPNDAVTRAQMATFLTRALHLEPMIPPPGYHSEILEIDTALAGRMSSSWRVGCPVPLQDLRYLLIDHWGFDGRESRGEVVVHADWADEVVEVFEVLFDERFPIERMVLVDDFGGDDLASMEANNTSAFNCRVAQGSTRWSEHAYGRAIDINPVQNPYVSGSVVLPTSGRAYLDRTLDEVGMIHAGDAVVSAFASIGWEWGGDWITLKDWQHFSSTGG